MLTSFESMDTLKMKFTVVMIWVIAISISVGMFFVLKEMSSMPLWVHLLMVIVVSLSIIAILLRCKVGRWFVLLGLYTFMFTPIMISLVPIFLLPEQAVIPIDMEHALIHLVVGGIAVYFMSNRESLEIFYRQSNFFEPVIFMILATATISLYIYFFKGFLFS